MFSENITASTSTIASVFFILFPSIVFFAIYGIAYQILCHLFQKKARGCDNLAQYLADAGFSVYLLMPKIKLL